MKLKDPPEECIPWRACSVPFTRAIKTVPVTEAVVFLRIEANGRTTITELGSSIFLGIMEFSVIEIRGQHLTSSSSRRVGRTAVSITTQECGEKELTQRQVWA